MRFVAKVKLATTNAEHNEMPSTMKWPGSCDHPRFPALDYPECPVPSSLSHIEAKSQFQRIKARQTRDIRPHMARHERLVLMSWTYVKPNPQRRSGGRKGTGGRPIGTIVNVAEQFGAICSYLLSSSIIDLGSCEAITLSEYFGSYQVELMKDLVRNVIRSGLRSYVSIFQGALLGTAVKVTLRDARTRRKQKEEQPISMINAARDGHATCTWVDVEGNVRCSCIGKTVFDLRSKTKLFSDGCCHHAQHFYSFFRSALQIGEHATKAELIQKVKTFALRVSANVDEPVPFACFKERVFLVQFKIGEDWEALDVGPRWVPIRHNIEKKTMTYAFCYLRSEKSCPHILAWRCHYRASLPALLFMNSGNPARPTRILTEAALENTSKIDPDFRERRAGRSYRPIYPNQLWRGYSFR